MQLMANAVTHPVGTSAERVYDDLREAIIGGEYTPGERLRTEALAERFGTSRTPVREALVLLEGDGLVELEPRRGAVVRSFDAADLVDLYEVRAILEARAAQLAALRLTREDLDVLDATCDRAESVAGSGKVAIETLIASNDEFHRVIVEASGSARLTAALRTVAGIPRPFKAAFWKNGAERTRSLSAHREIVAALRSRSAERAESAMRLHVLTARDFLIEVMGERH